MSRLQRTAQLIKDEQPQPFIGQIVGESDGVYQVSVNGRSTSRSATASNEFAFAAQGSGVGDQVIVIGADGPDMPTIIGLSPYII